jgi:hypothetical protein
MGGSSTRAYNVAKGLQKLGHNIIVVTAFPHYPHGNILKKYHRKIFKQERQEKIKIVRVWIPRLPHAGFGKRLILYLSFIFSSLFALPVVGKVDVVWAANPNFFCFFPALIYSLVKHCPIICFVA